MFPLKFILFMIHSLTHKKTKSGFTLIELLVVIAIIGILSTIVLASLSGARKKSRDVRRVTDIKQIQVALELYFDGGNRETYPAGVGTCSATIQYGLETLVGQGTIATLPRDPNLAATVNCYYYMPSAAIPTNYHLAAKLEDTTGTSQAMLSDRDCNDNVANGCGAAAFNGSGFHISGLSTDCIGGVGNDQCYDVTP